MKGCIGRIILFFIFLAIFAVALHIGFWVIGVVLAAIVGFFRMIFR